MSAMHSNIAWQITEHCNKSESSRRTLKDTFPNALYVPEGIQNKCKLTQEDSEAAVSTDSWK